MSDDYVDKYVHLEGCKCLFMGPPNEDGEFPYPNEETSVTTVYELITCPLCQIMAK
jgi:hypothetical protein